MCKVSVIIAVYNSEKYLDQCLCSVVNQTLTDLEIICINDGSTDNSRCILDKYAEKDSRIKVVSKENEGAGAAPARNLGLDIAAGGYVSILDSDDFFEPEMLEKMYKRAEETNADIVICGGMEFDNRNRVKLKAPGILNERFIPAKVVFSYNDCPKEIFQLTQGMAWNKLYRREFLDKHNIRFQRIKYTDDAFFTFSHMVLAERITVVNEPLVYYRTNTGTNQTGGLNNYPESAYLPYLELKKSMTEWGLYNTVKQSFVNCTAAFLRYCYDKVSLFEAFEFLSEKYRTEIFEQLDITGNTKDYFYDERLYIWQEHVAKHTAGELAFEAVRSLVYDNTTAPLRFHVPYEFIPRNSKIIIYGAGMTGVYYFTQIIHSMYCDIVLWCDSYNPYNFSYIHDISDICKYNFDYVLVAYVQPDLVKKAVDYLNSIGVANDKIILGGTFI